jgi:hypothetical protein
MNKYEMKNVEDYLEDGCVFVRGDKCANDNGYKFGNSNWIYFADDGECTFHTCIVTYFEWRNSTGTPPTYTNLVEVLQRDGLVYVDHVKNIDFTLELSDDDVVQWKPYIECELDWYLGGYTEIVEVFVNLKPTQQACCGLDISDSKRDFTDHIKQYMHITPDQQWPRS